MNFYRSLELIGTLAEIKKKPYIYVLFCTRYPLFGPFLYPVSSFRSFSVKIVLSVFSRTAAWVTLHSAVDLAQFSGVFIFIRRCTQYY